MDAAGEVVCRGEGYFPKRRAREWHKTEGYREEALCLEASKRSYLPCYTLRRRLGLPNGSSRVESANNEVTARRQKRNGMSWSKPGSHALTALSVLVCNRCQGIWVREHNIPLRFVDKAA